MAFMYPHHIPQLPFYEDLFDPNNVARRQSFAAQKDEIDKPSTLVPDPSWAPRSYRTYDASGSRHSLPSNRPTNAEQDEEQQGSPLIDPNPVGSDEEEDMASEVGSQASQIIDADDMDIDNANSEEEIEEEQ